MAGLSTNGLPPVAYNVNPSLSYPQLSGRALVAADTQSSQGAGPQSVAATAFQIAARAAVMSINTATSTTGATTQNTLLGRCVTEALTTAVGATYTYTLTNSVVAATSTVQAQIFSLTNTVPGMQMTSVTPAAGSVVFVFTNNGAAALNGTMCIVFDVNP